MKRTWESQKLVQEHSRTCLKGQFQWPSVTYVAFKLNPHLRSLRSTQWCLPNCLIESETSWIRNHLQHAVGALCKPKQDLKPIWTIISRGNLHCRVPCSATPPLLWIDISKRFTHLAGLFRSDIWLLPPSLGGRAKWYYIVVMNLSVERQSFTRWRGCLRRF